MIRVLIVDDQPVVCEGLKVMINAHPEFEVVGVGYSGANALELVLIHKPDLVLMDLNMPIMNGIHATRKIRDAFSEVKILVLTTYMDEEWIFDAIRAGASGYILKDSPREEILAAIQGVMDGHTQIDPVVADKLFDYVRTGTSPKSALLDDLNDREREVLRLVAQGLNNASIAHRLHLAEGTVRNYVSSILAKLEVEDRTQAAAFAWRNGLAQSSPDV